MPKKESSRDCLQLSNLVGTLNLAGPRPLPACVCGRFRVLLDCDVLTEGPSGPSVHTTGLGVDLLDANRS